LRGDIADVENRSQYLRGASGDTSVLAASGDSDLLKSAVGRRKHRKVEAKLRLPIDSRSITRRSI
jgi:hypothetical protein